MSTTTRHTSRLMNVTVFVENFRGVTITNDVETIAKKSAVVDDPEDVFAVFQNKELWDTLRGML